MPILVPKAAAVEVVVARGSLGAAVDPAEGTTRYLGGQVARRQVQAATNDPQIAWNDPGIEAGSEMDVTPRFEFEGRTIVEGDVFERQAELTDGAGGLTRSAGAWKLIGETRTPYGRRKLTEDYARINLDAAVTVAPEANWRTRNGLLMYDLAGDILVRGAVGEQDHDPVTGELLWDDPEQTIPTLVPAP